jgi:hypothetical protein
LIIRPLSQSLAIACRCRWRLVKRKADRRDGDAGRGKKNPADGLRGQVGGGAVTQTSELDASGVASGVASGDASGEVPEPPEPRPEPSAGQSRFGRAVDDGSSVPGFEGSPVVALGDGEADGSAADTAATPPRTRSPSAIVPTTMLRRKPPILVGAGGGG